MDRQEAISLLESKGLRIPEDIKESRKPIVILWRIGSGKLARMDEHGIFRTKLGQFLPDPHPDEGWKKARKILQEMFMEYTGE